MNKYYYILELNKIIEYLKEYVILEANKKLLEEIKLMNNLDEIQNALNEADEASILIQRMSRFPLYFRSDIHYILSYIHKSGVLSTEDLLEVGKFLDTIKSIIVYLESLETNKIKCDYFKTYVQRLFYPKNLNLRIKEIITPYGEIKDDASDNLRIIRKSIKDTEKNIHHKLQEILTKNSAKLTSNLVSIRNERYVIPVKNDQKNNIKGIIHDQSSSGETVFIEPALINELNNKLNQFYEDEKKEIYNILRTVSYQIDEFNSLLSDDLEIIQYLDLLFAKAEYGLSISANKPKINNQGILDLLNCRHPLLKVDKVIPNNVSIGKDYQGIIITGPNTGGKTVLLKTVGLLSLMVKMGLLIPCDEASNVMIFDNVFADIGDEQSIDQNLSTFSSHLKNVIDIMNQVTNNSLVLLDELGSGTDPAEGSSLAIAIFDYLIKKKCLVIATSHYSELKIYAYNSTNIINASVEFNIETLKPTYKLLLGVPGQSNALKISKMLGLPEEIIQRAEKYAYQKDNDTNQVLDKLIKQSHELDKKLTVVEDKNKELKQKIQDADYEKEKLVHDRNQILKNAEEEAKKIINNASKKIDGILDELNQMKLKEVKLHEISNVKHQVKQLKEEAHVEIEVIPDEKELEINDHVYVENYSCYGIILKKNKNNRYDVSIGNATVTVDQKYLKYSPKQAEKVIRPKTQTVSLGVKKNVSMNLDLRGMRYEDAYIKLEKYIDDAIYASLAQVSIIHGFGTGVIREMVINFLKTSDHVESFRYGGANEGGQGVTVVTLKNK